jgi:predicted nucleic acid-binding protein
LAIEFDDCLLIIDDLKGGKFAQQLGLHIIGTIGVIVDAKLSEIIPSIKPFISKIKNTNFRISDSLEKLMLEKAGEL